MDRFIEILDYSMEADLRKLCFRDYAEFESKSVIIEFGTNQSLCNIRVLAKSSINLISLKLLNLLTSLRNEQKFCVSKFKDEIFSKGGSM